MFNKAKRVRLGYKKGIPLKGDKVKKATEWKELLRREAGSDKIIARIIYNTYSKLPHVGFICGEDCSFWDAKHIFKNKDIKFLKFQLDLKLIQEGYNIKFPGR